MRLRVNLDTRFEEPLLIEGGRVSKGVVQRASDAETPALDFSGPRLTCRVKNNSFLNVGDVVKRTGIGQRYVLGEHSTTPWYRTFWMFDASRKVLWKSRLGVIDQLTGVEKAGGFAPAVEIWVGWETITRENFDRDIRIREELVRVITGANVQEGDQIDGQQVKRINPILGIKNVTVQ